MNMIVDRNENVMVAKMSKNKFTSKFAFSGL